MKTQKPLLLILVVLVGGMGALMHRMNSAPDGQPKPPPPPQNVQTEREKDLATLLDQKAHNWQVDPKFKVSTTKTRLQYQDIEVGKGKSPKFGDKVVVDYVGWTTNGRMFDTSLQQGRQPFAFPLGKGEVIKGWDEGVATMRVGGIRRLIVPSNLGYGEVGNVPMIEPNATLVFLVRLLDVQPGEHQ